MKIGFLAGLKFSRGLKNLVKKLKILKNQGLMSNECIHEQDFILIKVSKDIFEYARVRRGSVLRAHRRETRLTVYSAHSVLPSKSAYKIEK